MRNRDDLVKYYYVIAPDPGLNYTATITITAATLGFQPLIYAYANLVANGTFNASNLIYPSPANFTQKFERPFFMGDKNQVSDITTNYIDDCLQLQHIDDELLGEFHQLDGKWGICATHISDLLRSHHVLVELRPYTADGYRVHNLFIDQPPSREPGSVLSDASHPSKRGYPMI